MIQPFLFVSKSLSTLATFERQIFLIVMGNKMLVQQGHAWKTARTNTTIVSIFDWFIHTLDALDCRIFIHRKDFNVIFYNLNFRLVIRSGIIAWSMISPPMQIKRIDTRKVTEAYIAVEPIGFFDIWDWWFWWQWYRRSFLNLNNFYIIFVRFRWSSFIGWFCMISSPMLKEWDFTWEPPEAHVAIEQVYPGFRPSFNLYDFTFKFFSGVIWYVLFC